MCIAGSTAPRSSCGCASRCRCPGTMLVWRVSTARVIRLGGAAAKPAAKAKVRTSCTLQEWLCAIAMVLRVTETNKATEAGEEPSSHVGSAFQGCSRASARLHGIGMSHVGFWKACCGGPQHGVVQRSLKAAPARVRHNLIKAPECAAAAHLARPERRTCGRERGLPAY